MIALIRRERIGFMELVPVVAEVLADEARGSGRKLGERAPSGGGLRYGKPPVVSAAGAVWWARGRVVNSYGLTEATIDSTCYEGMPGDGNGDIDADSRGRLASHWRERVLMC